ncbi:MAG TPA: DUF1415 domain-containing protein [Burkholderiaceae bacterium]|nr:DUF1415 domain-containing protein [Burkholderiaceae bacterium]
MTEHSDFETTVTHDMQHWLQQAVIGLNLCPFAKSVLVRQQIHFVVSRANGPDQLEPVLLRELQALADADPGLRDTTLLMAPDCLLAFRDFNEFLHRADHCLELLSLQGVIQIASFHPQFQFAGTGKNDISNFTNRAPYPTLHLLRESSVDRAVAAFPQAEEIFEHNIDTMRQLGQGGWDALGIVRNAPVAPLAAGKPGKGGSRRGTIGR